MPKYILGYHGTGASLSKEEEERVNAAWVQWFRGMGPAVLDIGNPVGVNPVTGYSLIEAPDIDAAVEMAKGCPIFVSGGSIQVGEAIAF